MHRCVLISSAWRRYLVKVSGGGDVRLDGQELSKKDTFRYLGSMLPNDEDIDKDVSYRIKVDWLKWHQASSILCDPRVPLKLKGKFYRTAIWSIMLYGA
jgi:hypothetical protein